SVNPCEAARRRRRGNEPAARLALIEGGEPDRSRIISADSCGRLSGVHALFFCAIVEFPVDSAQGARSRVIARPSKQNSATAGVLCDFGTPPPYLPASFQSNLYPSGLAAAGV